MFRFGCAAIVLTALAVPGFCDEETFRWSRPIPAGQRIEIKGVNGGIRAEPAVGSQVEVVARKTGRRDDPRDVSIDVVPNASGITICAVYPSRHGEPNECKPDRGGRMNVNNNDVKVEFTVRVPPGVRFVGRTVNGAVEAVEIASDVEAHTVNGKVRVSSRGSVQAKTVNGSIEASMHDGNWIGSRQFETVNGGITVDLPDGLNADVSAQTVNGNITTDIPLAVHGRFSHRQMHGTIGGGGRELTLKTVNGSIRLRRAS